VNTPIPANPPISPYSAAIVANFVPHGSNPWNQYFIGPRDRDPVAYPDGSTPKVTVQVNFPTCANHVVSVPIPASIQLTPPNNEDYLVVMLPNGDQWDFWNLTKPGQEPYNPGDWGGSGGCSANGNWQAIEAIRHRPGWTGLGASHAGGSESGLFEAYGAIRLLDTQRTRAGGNWGHAINWTGFDNCAASNAGGLPRFVPPATEGNGANTNAGCFPMGARWQLDPSINCNTWPSMVGKPEWMKQMCRTLQVYGMIDAHSTFGQGDGDGFRVEYSANFPAGRRYPWQDPKTGAWPDPYSPSLNLPPDLLSHFRVIDWTKWTGVPKRR
jgi:hypothetical protein